MYFHTTYHIVGNHMSWPQCHYDSTSVKTWFGYTMDMSQGKLSVT